MIVLDTSVLIDALSGPRHSADALRRVFETGERVLVPALVLYEWLRGPRLKEELAAMEAIFPPEGVVGFGAQEAALAARLCRSVRRPRGREMDLAIAACAITRDAELWTLNTADFTDVPKLRLHSCP